MKMRDCPSECGTVDTYGNTQNKRDILSEKRESGMALKKREFTPESGTVDTYVMSLSHTVRVAGVTDL